MTIKLVESLCLRLAFIFPKILTHDKMSSRLPYWGVGIGLTCTYKKWAIPGLFFSIFVFSIQLTVNKCSINFADDWIRTVDLWYWKGSLYQLSHNHCQSHNHCLTCTLHQTSYLFKASLFSNKYKTILAKFNLLTF